MEEDTYICRTCQEKKIFSDFALDHGCRTPDCRGCRNFKNSEAAKRRRLENPEKYRQASKNRYKKNKEKIRERKYKWAKENPEKVEKSKEKYRKTENGIKKTREYSEKYRIENRENYRVYMRKWRRKRLLEDPTYEIMDRIRHSIRRLLEKKQSKSLCYTGCHSIQEFYEKISEKTENKNWVQDGFQIDHIFQINWFSEFLKTGPDKDQLENFMKKLHHHSNLRPIPAHENVSRSPYDVLSVDENLIDWFLGFLNKEIVELIKATSEEEKNPSRGVVLRGSDDERYIQRLFHAWRNAASVL